MKEYDRTPRARFDVGHFMTQDFDLLLRVSKVGRRLFRAGDRGESDERHCDHGRQAKHACEAHERIFSIFIRS